MDKDMKDIVDHYRFCGLVGVDVVMAAIDTFVARGYIEVDEIDGWASEIDAYLERTAA